MHTRPSVVPRPSLTAFFAANIFHGCEKSCEGRLGYEAILDSRINMLLWEAMGGLTRPNSFGVNYM